MTASLASMSFDVVRAGGTVDGDFNWVETAEVVALGNAEGGGTGEADVGGLKEKVMRGAGGGGGTMHLWSDVWAERGLHFRLAAPESGDTEKLSGDVMGDGSSARRFPSFGEPRKLGGEIDIVSAKKEREGNLLMEIFWNLVQFYSNSKAMECKHISTFPKHLLQRRKTTFHGSPPLNRTFVERIKWLPLKSKKSGRSSF